MKPMGKLDQLFQRNDEGPRRTLMELYGKNRLVVEYHRGILCYGEQEILIRTSYGMLIIQGTQLRLCRMSAEQLCIRGELTEIKLTGREQSGPVEPNQRRRPDRIDCC